MILLLSLLTLFSFHSQKITVKNAWLRPANKGMNSALYFEAINNSDKADILYSVSSNIAGMVQLHESFMDKGMMGMRMVPYIIIKPHTSFVFKEGSYHVMLILLKKDLKPGSKETFFLHFKNGGNVKVIATVKKN